MKDIYLWLNRSDDLLGKLGLVSILAIIFSVGVTPLNYWYVSVFALGFTLLKLQSVAKLKNVFLLIFLFFIVHYGISSYWVINTFQVVVSNAIAAIGLGFLALMLTASAMAFCMASAVTLALAMARKLHLRGYAYFLVVALFFTIGELARSEFLGGYPMHFLGYSLGDNVSLIQLASLGSVFIISFILVLIAQLVVASPRYFMHSLGFVLILFLFGQFQLQSKDDGVSLDFRLVNGNLSQKALLSYQNTYKSANHYIHASTSENSFTPDLYVWPESVLQFYIQNTAPSEQNLEHITSFLKHGQTLVAGGPSVEFYGDERDEFYYSSLFAVDSELDVKRYDKHRLVPWGEYLPFREFFPQSLADIFDVKDYQKGEGPLSMKLSNGLTVLPLLCAEGHFPQMLWQYQDNQNIIIMIGNEAWLAGTTEPDQYFMNARFRAIESGLPVILVSNKGHLAAFDSKGRLLKHSYDYEEVNVLDVTVKVNI